MVAQTLHSAESLCPSDPGTGKDPENLTRRFNTDMTVAPRLHENRHKDVNRF